MMGPENNKVKNKQTKCSGAERRFNSRLFESICEP